MLTCVWRVGWLGLGLWTFGCAGARGMYPTDTSQDALAVREAARAQQRCEAWGIGAQPGATIFDDTLCTQEAEAQRRFEATQTDRLQASIERDREQKLQQAGLDRELAHEALAGDGQYLGQGWYCYDGELTSRAFGQCDRDRLTCGEMLASRQAKGLRTETMACHEQAQAACFQVTRSLAEGPRVFCFPSTVLCEDNHARVAVRGDVDEQTECAVYR